MQVDNLSWFPGHMTKTRRMITAEIKNMDAVCEILDARIPLSSRNPDVDELTAGTPRLVVLNRVDQADPGATRRWAAYFRGKGYAAPALRLMLDHAFRDCSISRIHNDFAVTRNEIAAWETHRRAGFRELGVEDGFLHMMITREEYLKLCERAD